MIKSANFVNTLALYRGSFNLLFKVNENSIHDILFNKAYRSYCNRSSLHPDCKILKSVRFCSGKANNSKFPPLTDFPVIYWPSFFKYVKNSILSRLIIKQFYDDRFNLDKFNAASKHAVGVVSDYISRSDMKSLNDLVTTNIIEEVRKNLHKFSLKQVMELKIHPGDIYLSFPYEVGIILPDEQDSKKRFVEITMCYHVLAGYSELSGTPDFSLQLLDFEDKLYILNYRFFRDFSEGAEASQWIINGLNHCKPLVSEVYV